MLRGDGGEAESDTGSDSETEMQVKSSTSKTGKGDAAAWLAKTEGSKTMAKAVTREHKKKKFWEDYDSDQSLCELGIRDFDRMAEEWNRFVGDHTLTYYRKKGHMLEQYFESDGVNNNIRATLQSHINNMDSLNRLHRTAVDCPITAMNALYLHGPSSVANNGNRDYSTMVPVIPHNMNNAAIFMGQSSGPINFPGQQQQSNDVSNMKKRTLDRAIQMCVTCKHYKQHNLIHNEKHSLSGACTVPAHLYNTDTQKASVPV